MSTEFGRLASVRPVGNHWKMVARDPGTVFIAVYMMASRRHGTLYIGVTSQLPCRAYQHREGLVPGFTQRYDCKRLVWHEEHASMGEAIKREKQRKKYKREWKVNLIERENPFWDDLYPALINRLSAA